MESAGPAHFWILKTFLMQTMPAAATHKKTRLDMDRSNPPKLTFSMSEFIRCWLSHLTAITNKLEITDIIEPTNPPTKKITSTSTKASLTCFMMKPFYLLRFLQRNRRI